MLPTATATLPVTFTSSPEQIQNRPFQDMVFPPPLESISAGIHDPKVIANIKQKLRTDCTNEPEVSMFFFKFNQFIFAVVASV